MKKRTMYYISTIVLLFLLDLALAHQEQYEKLPANGSYMVAVWDDKGQVGRYFFVIGDREIPGGDIAFPLKIWNYWAVVNQSTAKNSQESIGTNQTNELQKGKSPIQGPGLDTVTSLMSILITAFFFFQKIRLGLNMSTKLATVLL
jgi:hypothetical protein